MKTVKIGLTVFLTLTFFCLSSQKAEWKGTVEEEDGVKVIKNPKEPLYGDITFDLEEDLSIGNEENENYLFYAGLSLGVDKKGNILALDHGNYRIQKYDRNGTYLQTIGRQGHGPGEFEDYFTSLYLDTNDNIYVLDKRRIHVFKNNGELLTTTTFKQLGTRNIREFRITKERNIIGYTNSLGEIKNGKPPDYRFSNVDLFDSDGKLVETITSYRRKIEFIKVDGKSRTSLPNYHQSRLIFCDADSELSVYGYSAEYKLFVINSSGNVVYKFVKDESPLPLTNEDKEKVLDLFMERQKTRNMRHKFTRGEAKKAMNFPKYKPLFSAIMRDDTGRIYVQRFKYPYDKNKGHNYDVFNKNGYYLYKARIPVKFPLIRHGYIYSTDYGQETDYAKIKRYKIKNWEQIKTGI